MHSENSQPDTILVNRMEMLNNLLYMDGIKTVCKSRKRIGNSNTRSENIQSRHRDRIWHRNMYHANNEKRVRTPDGQKETTKRKQN